MPEFKYDVAFSFLAADEQMAVRLADELAPRFSVFVYSQRQRDLAGNDGVLAFSKVFAKEARTVVVLYRNDWGHTKWTRVEQEAIRGRAFDEGYDFVLFVVLDERPSLPPWLPKTRLYYGLAQWGLVGACGVVEQRIVEAGGRHRAPTLEDVATRRLREIERERNRERFRGPKGLAWAQQQFAGVHTVVATLVAKVPEVGFMVQQRRHGGVEVHGRGSSLLFHWKQSWGNALDGSGLLVRLWDGPPDSQSVALHGPPNLLFESRYVPDLGLDGHPTWVDEDGRWLSMQTIIESALKKQIEALNLGTD